MARMPGAQWRPVPNCTKGGQDAVYGVVLHVMAGTLNGSDSWFRNRASQASAHFGIGKDGRIYQWVDTADRAWHASGANRTWLGIEHEGQGGDSLTTKQLAATASVIAWMHKAHGVKLQPTDSPTGRGVGWHGMGGAAWGGHTSCPGTPIKNQRDEILKAAGATSGSSPDTGSSTTTTYTVKKGDTLSAIAKAHKTTVSALVKLNGLRDADQIAVGQRLKVTGSASKPSTAAYEPFPGAGFFHGGRNSRVVTAMGRRLVAEGCGAYRSGPGPNWTNTDRESYRRWQKKLGYSGSDADGIPGAKSWAALRVPKS
jgi:N-acetylmuramoyl-L-alanine amidase CwlA